MFAVKQNIREDFCGDVEPYPPLRQTQEIAVKKNHETGFGDTVLA